MRNFKIGEQVVSRRNDTNKPICVLGVLSRVGDYTCDVDLGIGKTQVYYLDEVQSYPKNKIILDIINDL